MRIRLFVVLVLGVVLYGSVIAYIMARFLDGNSESP